MSKRGKAMAISLGAAVLTAVALMPVAASPQAPGAEGTGTCGRPGRWMRRPGLRGGMGPGTRMVHRDRMGPVRDMGAHHVD